MRRQWRAAAQQSRVPRSRVPVRGELVRRVLAGSILRAPRTRPASALQPTAPWQPAAPAWQLDFASGRGPPKTRGRNWRSEVPRQPRPRQPTVSTRVLCFGFRLSSRVEDAPLARGIRPVLLRACRPFVKPFRRPPTTPGERPGDHKPELHSETDTATRGKGRLCAGRRRRQGCCRRATPLAVRRFCRRAS